MAAPERAALLGLPPVAPDEPPPPEPPSFWREHVEGFFAENWYLVAGVVMVVVGARCSRISPGTGIGCCATRSCPGCWGVHLRPRRHRGLAGGAGRLASRNGRHLAGGRHRPLPVNFMAVALLAHDPEVSNKLVGDSRHGHRLPRPLRLWAQAVVPSGRCPARPAATSLLFLNGLVLLPALAGAVAGGRFALPLLVAGFHVGFFVLAAAVARFARDGLDAEATLDRRVPWFVGGTLVLTYLEVFAWVHGGIHWMPPAHVYAALVVLAGGLVLYAERRFLELRPEPGGHRAESFLGFAVLLLGVLMGADDPYMRILSLALAGAVWLYQASYRTEALHYWMRWSSSSWPAPRSDFSSFPRPLAAGARHRPRGGGGRHRDAGPERGEGRLRATCRELHLAS